VVITEGMYITAYREEDGRTIELLGFRKVATIGFRFYNNTGQGIQGRSVGLMVSTVLAYFHRFGGCGVLLFDFEEVTLERLHDEIESMQGGGTSGPRCRRPLPWWPWFRHERFLNPSCDLWRALAGRPHRGSVSNTTLPIARTAGTSRARAVHCGREDRPRACSGERVPPAQSHCRWTFARLSSARNMSPVH
jgi:hypothetical protein